MQNVQNTWDFYLTVKKGKKEVLNVTVTHVLHFGNKRIFNYILIAITDVAKVLVIKFFISVKKFLHKSII